MGIHALVGSILDSDVNGGGRLGLRLSSEQWVGSAAQRHLDAADNEVNSAE